MESASITIILLIALLLQIAAVFLSIRLLKITGKQWAWLLFSIAMLLMVIHHAISFYLSFNTVNPSVSYQIAEVTFLIISLLFVISIVKIIPIIESLKQLSNRLQMREEHFRSLYFSAPLAYQSLDKTGNLLDVNQAWLQTLGYSYEEVIGKWFGDFLLPHDVPYFNNCFKHFKEVGEIHAMELMLIRKDKTYIIASLDGKIGYDKNSEFKQGHCILSDITEQKRLIGEKEQLISDLQEALAHVKQLKGLLPICSSCKKIRDDQGYWRQLEVYIRDHSEAEFTHSFCPECAKKYFPDYFDKKGDS